MNISHRRSVFAVLGIAIAVCVATPQAGATTIPASGFVTAPSRADMAYDSLRGVLYISGTDSLLRYDMTSQSFLSPIYLGGNTLGMDISPDGRTLAVANTSRAADKNFVDLVDLSTGASSRVGFNLASGEGGTYTVAYDSAGKLLVSSRYEGSGWVPLRRYDPAGGNVVTLGSVRQSTMLTPSADNAAIAIAESNISNGPYGVYRTGDATYTSNRSTGWFNFEIGISRNGQQVAVPTYGGTYILDPNAIIPSIGTYAGQMPIAAAYSPVADVVFFPFANSNFIAAHNTHTGQELQRFTVPGNFDWIGNGAFAEGRTKLSDDGSYLFSTLDNGIYFLNVSAVPEASTWLLMALGLLPLALRTRGRSALK